MIKCTAAAVAVLLATSPSYAAPPAGASQPVEELISKGIALRNSNKNEEALAAFQAAHALAPSQRTFGQMGIAEASLRRWTDAEAHLAAALSGQPSPWTRKYKNLLEQTLGIVRSHIGEVNVAGPPGAELFVDGKSVGSLPLASPLRLSEGNVVLSARKDGYREDTRTVKVAGGQATAVSLELPSVVAVEPMPAPSVGAPVGGVGSDGGAADSTATKRWLGYGALGVGLAAVGVGIGWIVVDGQPTCDPPAGAVCPRLRDTKTQGIVSVVAGSAVAALGAFVLWSNRRDGELSLAVLPTGGLQVAGRF